MAEADVGAVEMEEALVADQALRQQHERLKAVFRGPKVHDP